MTDSVFNYIPNLKGLNVGVNSFTGYGISNLIFLTKLILNKTTQIADIHFVHLNFLEYLDCCDNNHLTDKTLCYLPNLKHLYRCSTQFTDNGLKYNINLLSLHCGYNTNFTNKSFIYLTKLQFLHCGYNTRINDYTLSFFPNLKYLYCGKNKIISDIGIIRIDKLKSLNLGSNKSITNSVIKFLNNLTVLN